MRGRLLLAPCVVTVAVGSRVPWRVENTLFETLTAEDWDATRTAVPPSQLFANESHMISSELDTFIGDIMRQWEVPGLQVAVVRRRADSAEYDIETKAYGVRGFDGRPMRTDTLFPIASNSKAFTAASVGLLVANESAPLTWSTKLRETLPEFGLQDPVAANMVNVVDMLGHRTGLPRHDFVMTKNKDSSLQHVKHFRPSAEIRDHWQYSNHMYNIAATLVSRVSKVPFFDFVRANLFEKIGFANTTISSNELVKSGRVANGYIKVGETSNSTGELHAVEPWEDLELYGPGDGCVFSTADDIALWLQTLLNEGKSPKTDQQAIPADVLALLSSGISVPARGVKRAPELGPSVYGMAFSSSSYQGHQYIEHGGALLGYYSQITRFPNDGVGIAVFVSGDSNFPFEIVRWRIAEEVLRLPVRVDWNTRYKQAKKAALQGAADDEAARLPSPHNAPPPSLPLEQLASTFSHPAYGQVSFSIDSAGTLIAETNWMGYPNNTLTLQHYSGNLFNATLTIFVPVLDQDEKVHESIKGMQVEFEVERGSVQGFGLWGGVWGAGVGVEPLQGTSARQLAEVWFDREIIPRYDEQASTQKPLVQA